MLFAALVTFSICANVFVMAPLDILNGSQKLTYKDKLIGWLGRLKNAKVDGIMIDVWWGLTERTEKSYDFSGYVELFGYFKDYGLKIIPVFSFHLCGGNVGDECNVPLPEFVTGSAQQPFFVDQFGHVDKEYISHGFDDVQIGSRTPVQMYKEWMSAFKAQFDTLISEKVIYSLEIGLGPAGEARFPSYQLAYWDYPGCGEFQSYDAKLKKRLEDDAKATGHSEWGVNPTTTNGYKSKPGEAPFWKDFEENSWSSPYGQWFMKWYASILHEHCDKVLKAAREVFPASVAISAKIAGIHWWYMTGCHCAENTAGYRNFYEYDGYRDIVSIFKKYNADVCFTCLEMLPGGSGSNPTYLVQQMINNAQWAGLNFEGENALPMYDTGAYDRVVAYVKKGLKTFTYLRLGNTLMEENNNFDLFAQFVEKMHQA